MRIKSIPDEISNLQNLEVLAVERNNLDFLNPEVCTRVIFYVRRIGLYLYKYRIYGAISIYILKGLAFVYQLI